MKIGVAGAGAVGCHYGSLLQQAGHELAYLARGAHLAALRRDGLLHVSHGVETRLAVRADDDAALLGDAEVVLLSGKMTDLSGLLRLLAGHMPDGALLVTLQNGVLAPEMAQQAFPHHAIAAGSAFIGVRIERPGVVVHSAAGGMALGHWQSGPGDMRLQPLIAALEQAGVPVREESDVQLMLWRKLLWNCGFNALTAITRRFARDMAAGEETLPLVRAAMAETVAVAQAAGVALSADDIDRHVQVTLAGTGTVKTSMWQDIERGRPTEVDFLNGFVAQRGAELGVATPVNDMLTVLMHAIEGGRQSAPDVTNE
jgi:2-dehydropantoate 2-reductase